MLRVFSPVGPGTPAGSPLGRLAEAMRRAMQSGDGELKLGGLGVQRDFVDVRDVARAVHAASLSAAQGVDQHRHRAAPSGCATPPPSSPASPATAAPSTNSTARTAPRRPTIGHPRPEPDHGAPRRPTPYPDGCGSWQQADVRTARDRLGWRPRINLEESLADIWMEAACRI